MRSRRWSIALGVWLVVVGVWPAGECQAQMTYVYSALADSDRRNDFRWDILREALDRTKDRYGPYELRATRAMSVNRQIHDLQDSSNGLTVGIFDMRLASQSHLLPIQIPIDKGLNGYRVFLIRAADQPRFSAIHTLRELQQIVFGQESDWEDVDVLSANGFRVETGVNYDGLFAMVIAGRFDAFPRGITEIGTEQALRRESLPDLQIESDLLLYYPWPIYFWFAPTAVGARLAARAEDGLRSMIADGSYDARLWQYFGPRLMALHLERRRIFVLKNPFLDPDRLRHDRKLWITPQDLLDHLSSGPPNR